MSAGKITLGYFNQNYIYTSDGTLDSWTVIEPIDGKYKGDCEDYCLTLQAKVVSKLKITLALESGDTKKVKDAVKEYYEVQDRQEFEAKLRAEYDALYPEYRDMTYEEYVDYTNNIEGKVVDFDLYGTEEYPYMPLEIDYSEDESYKTFEEYKNETIVVTEASYICDECQLALDNETCTNNAEHYTRLIPEVTELVRPYTPLKKNI